MTEFEPIRCWPIRLLWKKKSKMQGSFEALLLFIAKYHDNMEPMLKSLCKKHLSYKRRSAGNDDKGKIRIIHSCQKVSQNSVQMLKKLAVTSFFSGCKFEKNLITFSESEKNLDDSTSGVSPSLVSRYCEGYRFWST